MVAGIMSSASVWTSLKSPVTPANASIMPSPTVRAADWNSSPTVNSS
jgi:hypothetical protein